MLDDAITILLGWYIKNKVNNRTASDAITASLTLIYPLDITDIKVSL
ncbi:MAG: hypothetical protein QXW58_05940 [Thermosphaera sp.]